MILKEPENRTKFRKRIVYTSSARKAFSYLLNNLFMDSADKILMPSYIGETDKEGSGVFDPLRENKISFAFYKVNKDLSADLENLEALLKNGGVKALLVIHYFGFIQNKMRSIKLLCEKYNIVLIEDCAHGMHSKQDDVTIGDWGDFAFFSIHKIIPTDDGGYLKINNDSIKLLPPKGYNLEINKNTLESYYLQDYNAINKKKTRNYRLYLENWKYNDLIAPLYPELNEQIIPLNFPILVGKGLREKVYFRLIDKGIITCSLYYRMISELSSLDFPASYNLSDEILNLPVHQDTNQDDIELILAKLNEVIEELV